VLIIGNFYLQVPFEFMFVTLDYRKRFFSLVVPVIAVTAMSRVLCFMTNKLID